ncbi:MAG: ATP-binding protein, partial [Dolichospermum sp.]
MIDISKLKECSLRTEVKASSNIFEELGKNTYNYLDVISELIDNSLAAKGKNLEIKIKLYFDKKKGEKLYPVRLTITDNANGINQDKLGQAITPAGVQSRNSLNEHGLGMKQAISALGKLEYLATKTLGEEQARVVTKFDFGDIPT